MPHIDKRFLYICHIDNVSICGIDIKFMSILGIDKLSILCIYNTFTYDVEKIKISTSQK